MPERADATGPRTLAARLGRSPRAIWVNWERQRRSRELAACLGVPIHTLLSRQPYGLRIVLLSFRTLWLLATRRPELLVVQNPSIVLTALACAIRRLFGFVLVVDRHSNFRLEERTNPALKWRTFHLLSRFTVRAADLTVVTNQNLNRLVAEWGGRGFVLPDKIPDLPCAVPRPPSDGKSVVFICSHEADEPIREVLLAAAAVPDITVHVTGDGTATRARYADLIGPNVRLTGYLAEADYQALLASCDAVLALTDAENTLLCGAYEAVSVGKPLILSNREVLTGYFHKGRVVTEHTPERLAESIRLAVHETAQLSAEVRALREELQGSWNESWDRLLESLDTLLARRSSGRSSAPL